MKKQSFPGKNWLLGVSLAHQARRDVPNDLKKMYLWRLALAE